MPNCYFYNFKSLYFIMGKFWGNLCQLLAQKLIDTTLIRDLTKDWLDSQDLPTFYFQSLLNALFINQSAKKIKPRAMTTAMTPHVKMSVYSIVMSPFQQADRKGSQQVPKNFPAFYWNLILLPRKAINGEIPLFSVRNCLLVWQGNPSCIDISVIVS